MLQKCTETSGRSALDPGDISGIWGGPPNTLFNKQLKLAINRNYQKHKDRVQGTQQGKGHVVHLDPGSWIQGHCVDPDSRSRHAQI